MILLYKIKQLLLLLLLLLISTSLLAANKDSLKIALEAAQGDEEIEILKKLVSAYTFKKPDSAIFYSSKIIDREGVEKDPDSYVFALNFKSINLWRISKYDSALYYSNIAEKYIKNIKDSASIANTYQYKAIIYNDLGKFPQAAFSRPEITCRTY